MKKWLFCIFLSLLFCSQTFAQNILTGEVSQSANIIENNLYDYQNGENLRYLLLGKTDLIDRTLAYFSDNTYAVMKHSDRYHVYYYSKDGILLYLEENDGLQYPYKSFKYNSSNQLVNKTLRVSKEESYIYSPAGTLIAHWKGSNAYDKSGKVIMSRHYNAISEKFK